MFSLWLLICFVLGKLPHQNSVLAKKFSADEIQCSFSGEMQSIVQQTHIVK
jgi:hypothetical protein